MPERPKKRNAAKIPPRPRGGICSVDLPAPLFRLSRADIIRCDAGVGRQYTTNQYLI